MAEVIQLIVSAGLQICLSFLLIRRDERQLTGTARARRYPEATFWVAVVVFGPLSIPIHFCRTRRRWTGLVLGLAWLSAVLGALLLAEVVLAFILE